MRARRLITGILVLAAVAAMFAGCATEQYRTSENLLFLWQQHPSPWSESAARAAAKDAKGLMAENPGDFQIELYYQDRLQTFDSDSLVSEYTRKLERDPDDARMILLEARAVGGRNRTADAMRKAVEVAPEDPYVLAFTSRALLRSRPAEPEKAHDYAQTSVQQAPDLVYGREALAASLFEAERYQDALLQADNARELNHYRFDPVYYKMKALEALEREDEALKVIEDYVRQHPAHPTAQYYLERFYRERDQLGALVEFKRIAAETNPQEGWAWLELANLYQETGSFDSSLTALDRAVDEGFYDLDLLMNQMSDEAKRELVRDRHFQQVQARMQAKRRETAPERRQEALSDRMDMPAPQITATTTDGREVKLSDLRGEVVVLDFWATWCGPCQMTIPRLKELYSERKNDFELVSVNVWEQVSGEQRAEKVEAFAREEGMKWRVWLAANEAADAYEVRGIPTFVVIDPEGTIRYRLVGYQPFLDETLGWMVDAAR